MSLTLAPEVCQLLRTNRGSDTFAHDSATDVEQKGSGRNKTTHGEDLYEVSRGLISPPWSSNRRDRPSPIFWLLTGIKKLRLSKLFTILGNIERRSRPYECIETRSIYLARLSRSDREWPGESTMHIGYACTAENSFLQDATSMVVSLSSVSAFSGASIAVNKAATPEQRAPYLVLLTVPLCETLWCLVDLVQDVIRRHLRLRDYSQPRAIIHGLKKYPPVHPWE
jgi:hypothetical protein